MMVDVAVLDVTENGAHVPARTRPPRVP
jgi:hypothetical protein